MGLEVFRRLRLHLDTLAGLPPQPSFASLLIQSLDRPIPNQGSSSPVFCPPKKTLFYYIDIAFRYALGTQPFVDQAAVERAINCTYSNNGHTRLDHDEMALIYSLVALGEYSDSNTLAKDNVELGSAALKG